MNAIYDDPAGIERPALSPQTSNAGEGAELVYCFEQAVHQASAEALVALQDAATASGAVMRARGVPPERALVAMKELLRHRGPSIWSPSLVENRYAAKQPPEADVYRQLFAWWVSGYYERSS